MLTSPFATARPAPDHTLPATSPSAPASTSKSTSVRPTVLLPPFLRKLTFPQIQPPFAPSKQLPPIDLTVTKASLDSACRSRNVDPSRYWTTLHRYLVAELSKAELDKQVPELLGWSNIPLHNELFLAILHNVAFGPPSVVSKPSTALPFHSRSPAHSVQAPPKMLFPRSRASASSLQRLNEKPLSAMPRLYPGIHTPHRPMAHRVAPGDTLLTVKSKNKVIPRWSAALPTTEYCHSILQQHAFDVSVEVPEQPGKVLQAAVVEHLRGILKEVLDLRRLKGVKGSVTLGDLLAAVDRNPRLIRSSRRVLTERLLAQACISIKDPIPHHTR